MDQLMREPQHGNADDQDRAAGIGAALHSEPMDSATGEIAQLDDVVCKPCDRMFTTQRAYVRHMRENKRHRVDDEGSERLFKCRLCATTCARQYDLRRHQLEQHHDGTLDCEACGTQYRPGSHSEDDCATWSRARGYAISIVDGATSAVGSSKVHTSVVANFQIRLKPPTRSSPLTPSNITGVTAPPPSPPSVNELQDAGFDGNGKAKKPGRPICGHCHQKFEKTQAEVIQHIGRHRSELDLRHICLQCDVSFIREQDLVHHQQNAKTGDCGFCFDHVLPCSGHHPVFCVDREEFCTRVRSWEQSQLQLFVRSVNAYLRYRRTSSKTTSKVPLRFTQPSSRISVPSQVDYSTRMGDIAAEFDNLKIYDRIIECSQSRTYSPVRPSLRASPPPRPVSRQTRPSNNKPAPWRPPAIIHHKPDSTTFTPPYSPEIPPPLFHGTSLPSAMSRPWPNPQVRHFASNLLYASRNGDGGTLLHEFARLNNDRAMSILLDAGVSPDDKDDDGRTALHTACRYGSYAVVEELIRSEASLNEADSYGSTPLHYAVLAGDYKIVRTLLSEGVDASLRDKAGCTPLHLAFRDGNDYSVMELFSYGADVWVKDEQGNTPLDLASVTSNGRFPGAIC